MKDQAAQDASSPAQQVAWPWRWLISGILIMHLAAVFTAPFAFVSRPSPLGRVAAEFFQPYLEWAYLNHGYSFFAPQPGESHLVRYRLEFAGDRQPLQGTFPDLDAQWPRLFYHRHFMLSEFLNLTFVAPQPPPAIARDPYVREQWQQRRELYVALRESFGNHLKAEYGAAEISLTRLSHRPPTFLEVQRDQVLLSDERLYQALPEDRSEALPLWLQ